MDVKSLLWCLVCSLQPCDQLLGNGWPLGSLMFSCVFFSFPYGVLGHVWYLIESIPDLAFLSILKFQGNRLEVRRKRSGIDTIKYYTRPRPPYGKVTKTQENNTYKRAKRSSLSQQVTTRLQGTDNSYTCAFLRKITNLKTSSAAI